MTHRGLGFLTAIFVTAGCGGDSDKPDVTADTTSSETTPICGGEVGSEGCECRSDGTCDADLTCMAGICADATAVTSGLALPAGARGCEILLSEAAGTVSDVRFAMGVQGTFIREAPRVAIAVIAASDADFPAGAVEVMGVGSPPATVVSATCVDAAGAKIEGATVELK